MNYKFQKAAKPALIALGAILAAGIVYGVYLAANPPAPPIEGVIEAKTVDIASKVPGRVKAVPVKEGDDVKKGAVLVEISLPEIEAKLRQVKAQESAAAAKADMVDEGVRKEDFLAAKALRDQAQAACTLARNTYSRMAALYKDGLISKQSFEEVKTKKDAAEQNLVMAEQKFAAAQTGARAQEKAAAQALLEEARGGVSQVSSLAEESALKAPRDAEVSKIFVEEGEIAAAGFPVVSLVDLSDIWAVFNVKENDLPAFAKGSLIKVKIPALRGETYTFKVYFLNPRASYATWRSSRQNTGYDLRTFEVRARPVSPITGLRPGMSAVVE